MATTAFTIIKFMPESTVKNHVPAVLNNMLKLQTKKYLRAMNGFLCFCLSNTHR